MFRTILNDAAPPGDARLALPLLPAGKPFLLAAVVGASGGRGSRLLTGPRQRAVPVGDAAAGAVKADSPAAASAVPVASPEGHLALQRPRGAGQPPAAAAAAELRHQPPGCSSAAPRSPSPLPQPLLGGAAPSAFWVFTSGGGSAKVSLHRAFGTEIASLQEGGRGGGRLGAVSVSTSARSVSPSAPRLRSDRGSPRCRRGAAFPPSPLLPAMVAASARSRIRRETDSCGRFPRSSRRLPRRSARRRPRAGKTPAAPRTEPPRWVLIFFSFPS